MAPGLVEVFKIQERASHELAPPSLVRNHCG